MTENPFVVPVQNQTTGFASPAESEREPGLSLDRRLITHPAATFLLRAQGNWPEYGIQPGDLVVVDRAWEPGRGLLALGIKDGNFCLGRLRRTTHGWRLGSAQEEVWGIVCHVIHTLV